MNLEKRVRKFCVECKEYTDMSLFDSKKLNDTEFRARYKCSSCSDIHEYHVDTKILELLDL